LTFAVGADATWIGIDGVGALCAVDQSPFGKEARCGAAAHPASEANPASATKLRRSIGVEVRMFGMGVDIRGRKLGLLWACSGLARGAFVQGSEYRSTQFQLDRRHAGRVRGATLQRVQYGCAAAPANPRSSMDLRSADLRSKNSLLLHFAILRTERFGTVLDGVSTLQRSS